MSKRPIAAILIAMIAGVMLTACGQEPSEAPAPDLENGISAIEDAMTKQNENYPANPNMTDDLRDGSSEDTVATPGDFPEAYNYGSGKIADYSRTAMQQKLPEPAGNETVLNTAADPSNIQVLYLWKKNNVPAKTEFTQDMTGYFDNYDFRPYVTAKKGRIFRSGEGQRPNKTYFYRYHRNGDKKWSYVYAPTLEELRQKEEVIQRDLLDGIDYAGGEITVAELVDRYINLRRGLKENSMRAYGSAINRIHTDPFGS